MRLSGYLRSCTPEPDPDNSSGLLGRRIRRRIRQTPPRRVCARRHRGTGGADQAARAQGRFRRTAGAHHLLCLSRDPEKWSPGFPKIMLTLEAIALYGRRNGRPR